MRPRSHAVIPAFVGVLVAGLAEAAIPSKADVSCVKALNAGGLRVASAQQKLQRGCVAGESRGKLPDADACIAADARGQVAKAAAKVAAAADGTLTVRLGATTFHGLLAVEDLGDRGDTYDFDPVDGDPGATLLAESLAGLEAPDAVFPIAVSAAPTAARLE